MIVGQNTLLNQYVPTFYIKDLRDGQSVVYDSVRKAFVNSDIVGGSGATRLGELQDVSSNVDNPLSLQNGQALVYDAACHLWVNEFIDYNTLINKPTNGSYSFAGLSDTAKPSLPNGYVKWNSDGTQLIYSTTIPASSITGLATVATTGDYNDLINKPTVGTGTVTSVDVSGGVTGLTTSGGPITDSGVITLSGTLSALHGGTGANTYITGDMLYASAADTLNKLNIGTNGQVLTVSSGVPVWSTPSSGGSVTSVSIINANGFDGTVDNSTTTPAITISTTVTGLVKGNGSAISAATGSDINTTFGTQTANYVYAAPDGLNGNPSFRAIVANDIPTLNQDTTGTANNVTGIVTEVHGGTGTDTYITGDILYASAANTLSKRAIGTNGQVLTVSGGVPVWSTVTGTGSVTSVDVSGGTTGLTTSGGPVTDSGTITLAGTLAISNGGTGATTANAAFNALVPVQTGNSGKFLTTDGTDTSWATISGTGTVTSIDVSGGTTGLTTSGGPVTDSGTITLAGTLAISNGGTGATTASDARTNLGASTVGSNLFTLTDPNAVTYLRINADNTVSTLDATSFRTAIGAGTSSTTGTVTSIDVSGGTTGLTTSGGPVTDSGTITLDGTLSEIHGGTGANTYITGDMLYASATDTLNKLNIGTNGQVLTVSSGVPTWSTVSGTGTVTSVAMTVPDFLSVTGSPITSSGTLAVSLSGTALPIENGGTGANTANAAFNNLVPSQTGYSGKFLTTDGTNTSWATVSGTGTVTSIDVSGGTTGLTTTGGPVTDSGTITLDGTLSATHGGTGANTYITGDLLYASDTDTLSKRAIGTNGQVLTVSGGVPVWSTVTGTGTVTSIDVSGGTTGLTTSGGPVTDSGTITLDGILNITNGGTGANTAVSARTNLGATTVGSNLFTLTDPNAVTYLRVNADNTVSTLDATSFRTAIGAGTSSTTGTVTSVDVSGGTTGLTTTGGPVTDSGTITLGGTLATTNGGTGLTAFAATQIFYAGSTSTMDQSANFTFDGTSLLTVGGTQALTFDGANAAVTATGTNNNLTLTTNGTGAVVITNGAITSGPGALSLTSTAGNLTVALQTGSVVNVTGTTAAEYAAALTDTGLTNKLYVDEAVAAAVPTTITLTGDVTGSGSDTIETTLKTVNDTPGTYANAHFVPTITVNEKGLVTSITTQHVDTSVRDIVVDQEIITIDARHQYIVTGTMEVDGRLENNGRLAIL